MGYTNTNKTWVGNMYHKFECICQDVDGFITKGTANYVGNQVQSVGDNMKRLYSGVVQDFLSPHNPVEQEGQSTRREQSNASAETGLSFHNDGDAAICRSSHLNFKESMTMGAQGSHSSCNTSSESLQSSLHGVGPTTAQKDDTLSKSFPDDPNLSLSCQIKLKGDSIQEVKIVTEELGSTEYQNSSRSQLLSASHLESDCRTSQEDEMVTTRDATEFVSEGSSMLVEEFVTGESSSSDDKTLSEALHDTDDGSEFTDDGTMFSSFSSASCHVSDASHDWRQLHGKTMRVEQSLNLGSDSSEDIALKSHTFSNDQDHKSQVTSVTSLNDPGLGSFHKRTREHGRHADSGECGSRVSSDLKFPTSSATFSCVNNAIDVMPDFCSTASSSDFRGASEDDLKHGFQHNQLTALISPVETDPCMETIDLSDKEKLDFSCVQMDSNKPLNTVSSGPRRLKSYKKLIQDALTSRKKLVTEYKLLAIWYGDIDPEGCQHSMDSPANVPATSLQSCKCCESGWELL
ncbi:PREDICTED: uncharacterized protein LOC109187658 [Ipomoea nil]|uniref:uncharacterized protein LOC109187658 n=1 Tax=Ipomoea nil TaxID=35883 RepID=UPI000900E295|nr:PREDICTED: uncharacterized protein LOC109187658 [Ipomoea nil]